MNVDRRFVAALFLALLLPAGASAEFPDWISAQPAPGDGIVEGVGSIDAQED